MIKVRCLRIKAIHKIDFMLIGYGKFVKKSRVREGIDSLGSTCVPIAYVIKGYLDLPTLLFIGKVFGEPMGIDSLWGIYSSRVEIRPRNLNILLGSFPVFLIGMIVNQHH